MANGVWRITATGRGTDSRALNGLRIVYSESGQCYYLMTAPPNSTTIAESPGLGTPQFDHFSLSGSPWTWSLSTLRPSPNPSGNWDNNNPAPKLEEDLGTWQSEAVPEPLPESLLEGKEGKEGKESAGAASY